MSINPNTRHDRSASRKRRVAAVVFAVACATLIAGVGDAAVKVPLLEYFTNLF